MNQTIYDAPETKGADRDERLLAGLNYVLLLLGNIIALTSIIAVVMAYIRKDGAASWLKSHYDYQIRTFWYAVAGLLVSSILVATILLSPIGLLGYLAIWVWMFIRGIVGLVRLADGRGIEDPRGLWI